MFKQLLFIAFSVSSMTWTSLSYAKEKIDIEVSSFVHPEFKTTFTGISVNSHSHVAIVLNDGSKWVIRHQKTGADQTLLSWHVGDEVRIAKKDAGVEKGNFILKMSEISKFSSSIWSI